MSANLFPARLIEEINKPQPRLVYAVKIEYNSVVRAHTGVGDLVIDGEVYLGIGQLGSIDAIADDNTTSPSQLTMTLSGLDPTLVAQTLNERNNNKLTRIYLVALDEDDRAASAALIFAGKTTRQVYNHNPDDVTVEVSVADRLIDWSRVATDRFTDESHRSSPASLGDRFFRFILQMVERPIYWGSAKDAPGFRY